MMFSRENLTKFLLLFSNEYCDNILGAKMLPTRVSMCFSLKNNNYITIYINARYNLRISAKYCGSDKTLKLTNFAKL